ncbi:MAG: prepilin-type N-terminal cleavage/methylation domain-containing protein [Nevskiaceae bacterium]|jgi:type IV pilus assembly protein PilV|nr:prepilin-type N-terminal cleavage/methylation domain-containing protein [Nevskiaceae bacterium]
MNLQRSATGQRGATLTEVLVAMLLFSLGVVGLLRALASAVTDTGAVQYRSTAAAVADSQLGRMWVDRGNLASYAEEDAAVPELPSGTRTVTVNGNVVTVTITWQAPSATARSTHEVVATIAGPGS